MVGGVLVPTDGRAGVRRWPRHAVEAARGGREGPAWGEVVGREGGGRGVSTVQALPSQRSAHRLVAAPSWVTSPTVDSPTARHAFAVAQETPKRMFCDAPGATGVSSIVQVAPSQRSASGTTAGELVLNPTASQN